MKINITVSDKQYAQALGLTLARCMKALVSIDGEDEADFVLCDQEDIAARSGMNAEKKGASAKYISVSKFEPVSCVIDRIRAAALLGGEEEVPNVKAVAVTGISEEDANAIALIMARLISRLYDKRVLHLSFNSLAGPSEAFVYDILAKGRVDLSLLTRDSYGVTGCDRDACALNPLRRLSSGEVGTLLRMLGGSDACDLIVIDITPASPHWELCMRVCEAAVAAGDGRRNERIMQLYDAETRGLGRISDFACSKGEDGDIYGETGARMRLFIQEALGGLLCEE